MANTRNRAYLVLELTIVGIEQGHRAHLAVQGRLVVARRRQALLIHLGHAHLRGHLPQVPVEVDCFSLFFRLLKESKQKKETPHIKEAFSRICFL